MADSNTMPENGTASPSHPSTSCQSCCSAIFGLPGWHLDVPLRMPTDTSRLQRDPELRMTAEQVDQTTMQVELLGQGQKQSPPLQALAHPWIAEREQMPCGTESTEARQKGQKCR